MTFSLVHGQRICSVLTTLVVSLCLCACASASSSVPPQQPALNTAGFIVTPLNEPETTDFQCTTIDYTIALNVFDRLVETRLGHHGEVTIVPSLAESWEVSDDGLTYTFHLRDDVSFSNGEALTTSDVRYTFVRLLTNPRSCNQDIVSDIHGAAELARGETNDLAGFRTIDDHHFQLVLERPYSALLACLSMPGASILDEQTTKAAGERFGKDPAVTVGTGPFVFAEWAPGERILLAANPNCWRGPPRGKGVDLRFIYDADTLNEMFNAGELDVVNLDDLGDLGEYYLHGNAYAQSIRSAPHVGIDYIALNESVAPLDDVRVRKALQLALNRQALIDAALGGRGTLEHGLFPEGLLGHNPTLDPIPYDPAEAQRLLTEAGYEGGFDLAIGMRASSTPWQRQLMDMACAMWEKVGVRPSLNLLSENDFMDQRTSGKLACYTASWAADYNDPDNFAYTFFGSRENSTFRSLCYTNDEAIGRVAAARTILNKAERLKEYQDLERIIIQDDAAWIPLFSRERNFLVSNRLINFTTAWNGWYEMCFDQMWIEE